MDQAGQVIIWMIVTSCTAQGFEFTLWLGATNTKESEAGRWVLENGPEAGRSPLNEVEFINWFNGIPPPDDGNLALVIRSATQFQVEAVDVTNSYKYAVCQEDSVFYDCRTTEDLNLSHMGAGNDDGFGCYRLVEWSEPLNYEETKAACNDLGAFDFIFLGYELINFETWQEYNEVRASLLDPKLAEIEAVGQNPTTVYMTTPQTTNTPTTEKAPTTDIETTIPSTTEPETTHGRTTQQITTLAETTEPETTYRQTTEPITTLAETTQPKTSLGKTTKPITTVADTTQPETTLVLTTAPETPQPETTHQETTFVATTESDTALMTAQATVTEPITHPEHMLLQTTQFEQTHDETIPDIFPGAEGSEATRASGTQGEMQHHSSLAESIQPWFTIDDTTLVETTKPVVITAEQPSAEQDLTHTTVAQTEIHVDVTDQPNTTYDDVTSDSQTMQQVNTHSSTIHGTMQHQGETTQPGGITNAQDQEENISPQSMQPFVTSHAAFEATNSQGDGQLRTATQRLKDVVERPSCPDACSCLCPIHQPPARPDDISFFTPASKPLPNNTTRVPVRAIPEPNVRLSHYKVRELRPKLPSDELPNPDEEPISIAIGSVAIVTMAFTLFSILIVDASSLWRDLLVLKTNLKSGFNWIKPKSSSSRVHMLNPDDLS